MTYKNEHGHIESCADCKYWLPMRDQSSIPLEEQTSGICRRNPPVREQGFVRRDKWCGEFEFK